MDVSFENILIKQLVLRCLTDILEGITTLEIKGPDNPDILSIRFDSRQIEKGHLFVAVKGTRTDGHRYIDEAVSSGARAVICEELPGDLIRGVTYIRVRDSAEALGMVASNYHGWPSAKLKVIGVTGTNGKTTVVNILYRLFRDAGYTTGMLSTLHNRIGDQERDPTHTTPDALQIQALLAEMVSLGCSHCFMEVSSHAIHQKRIAGIRFHGGIFTNITHEHLDYHLTFGAYLDVKKSFFDELPQDAFALVNTDDRNAGVMMQNCRAPKASYGLKGMQDYKGKIIESHLDGMHMLLDGHDFWTRFTGSFNAYNLLAAYGCAVLCGLEPQMALTLLSRQLPVKGRFEMLHSKSGVKAIVDYAHTPDALRNVLSAINQVKNVKSRLITVVGAGGNRDAGKRPLLGRVAVEMSQSVILTSDNPRFEKPDEIIQQMMDGIPGKRRKNVLSITDRGEAIKTAVMLASSGDIILVAGKGHETYQEIQGNRIHFDDRETLEKYLK